MVVDGMWSRMQIPLHFHDEKTIKALHSLYTYDIVKTRT